MSERNSDDNCQLVSQLDFRATVRELENQVVRVTNNKGQDMKKKTDFKSVAIGVLLGAVAVLSFGAAQPQNGATGRYRLTVYEQGGRVLKIDTATGQIWSSSMYAADWQQFASPQPVN